MKVLVCQHRPCGKPLSKNADARQRYCADRCRVAASRIRKATTAVTRGRPASPEATGERYPALRGVWDAVAAQIAAEGVTVAGSSGVPVAHPLLRFLGQLDTALSAHERASETADDADPVAVAQAAARAAMEAYRRDRDE